MEVLRTGCTALGGSVRRGINTYVSEARSGSKPMPPEFILTASEPDDWEAIDVVRIRSHALVSNVTSEVARAQVICAAGLWADRLRQNVEPESHKVRIPQGLNPCEVPPHVLKDYLLATKPVDFKAPTRPEVPATSPARVQLTVALDTLSSEGSNNWVVAPNIGWVAAGRTPVRKNWDGLLPVPGDGRYEWAGFHGNDVLPSIYNPAEGFFASANEMNLPSGYPNEENKIAFEWTSSRSRIDRIKEMLRANSAVSLADSMAIQSDTVSVRAATARVAGSRVDSSQFLGQRPTK